MEMTLKEIHMMEACDSEYVVQYYANFIKEKQLWIVMEYCAAGSISDVMRLTGNCISQDEIALITRGILHGLAYLHSRNKIHRDIKSGNILLNAEGQIKLADFGVAGQLMDASSKRNTIIGTPFWMAPEVIQENGYGVNADIWSLGITIIEMAQGRPPYHNLHPMRAIFLIPSKPPPTLETPTDFSPEINAFIARCLTKDPSMRPSAYDLLQDPFIIKAQGSHLLQDLAANVIELIRDGHLQIGLENEHTGERHEDGADDEGQADGVILNQHIQLDVGEDYDDKTVVTRKSRFVPKAAISSVPEHFGVAHQPAYQYDKTEQQNYDSPRSYETTIRPSTQQREGSMDNAEPLTFGAMSDQPQIQYPIGAAPLGIMSKNLIQACDSLQDFHRLYGALQVNLEKEIRRVKREFEMRRWPIQEAISRKGNDGVQ